MASRNPRIMLLAEATGGVTRHVIDLYNGLRSRGWRAGMILSPLRLESRYHDELDQVDQQDIAYVPMHRAPHATDLKAYFEIAEILKRCPGETILHAHSTKAGMIGALLHSKVRASIFTPHAYRGVDPNASRSSKAFLRQAEHTFSKDYDRILTVAPGEMQYARGLGLDERILRCIPNGLDTSHIQFSEVLLRRRQLHTPPCVGFVGRLVYQKNPLLFLHVFAEVVRRVPDTRAIIVGDGPMSGKMCRLAEKLGIARRIDWRGDIAATESLHEMDVMVHTSLYEGFPYSLIEACADLLPTVATSNFGSEAIFRSRLPTNIATSPDATQLASIVQSILESESRRIEQLSALAEIAREYSLDAMITGIEAEYLELISTWG